MKYIFLYNTSLIHKNPANLFIIIYYTLQISQHYL